MAVNSGHFLLTEMLSLTCDRFIPSSPAAVFALTIKPHTLLPRGDERAQRRPFCFWKGFTGEGKQPPHSFPVAAVTVIADLVMGDKERCALIGL